MADELQPGFMWVKCGIHKTQVPAKGKKVGDVRFRLTELLSISPNAQARLDGNVVTDDHTIDGGTVLEFVRAQGEKAVDKEDPRGYTAWAVGELRDEVKGEINQLKSEMLRNHTQAANTVSKVAGDVATLKNATGQMQRDVATIAQALKDGGNSNGVPPALPVTHGHQGRLVGYSEAEEKPDAKKDGYTVGISLSPRRLFRSTLLMGLLGILTWGGARVYHDWRFDSNFTQYMAAAKEAREKGDIPRAVKYEERGLLWVKAQNMTDGRTDVLLDAGPNADVKEWYEDTKRAIDKAKDDHKRTTQPVSYDLPPPPSGMFTSLSLYPYNQHFAGWLAGSVAFALFGACGVFCTRNKKKKVA